VIDQPIENRLSNCPISPSDWDGASCAGEETITLACASDDRYIMPLAVTLVSAAVNLAPGWRLRVFILDGGITDENRDRFEKSLSSFPIELNWLREDLTELHHLSVSHHISHVAYYRLMLEHVLPEDVDRVLYMDCDLLVKADLSQLWQTKLLNESVVGAVPDIACPYIDANLVPHTRIARPYLATLNPIRNYRRLKLKGDDLYFNSGLLLIDLAAWRKHRFGDQFLKCLTDHSKFVWCWDQYALNVVLAGRWQALPMHWNQGAHAFEFPSVDHSPVDHAEFRQMRDDPSIIHFTTEWKPWHFTSNHPARDEFFDWLDKTAWCSWRPERPDFSIKRWWQSRAVGIQKNATITYRKVTTLWS
jgi:lipopolysaccharide biosynthesis glycosyltransferase